jgi:hypothetical protein
MISQSFFTLFSLNTIMFSPIPQYISHLFQVKQNKKPRFIGFIGSTILAISMIHSACAMELLVSLKKPMQVNKKAQVIQQLKTELRQLNLSEPIESVEFISENIWKVTTRSSSAPVLNQNIASATVATKNKVKQLQYNLQQLNQKNSYKQFKDTSASSNHILEQIELDDYKQFLSIPTDTHWSKQWYLQPLQSYVNMTTTRSYGLDFQSAWSIAKGQGQIVAVVDSGYIHHADLGGNATPGSSESAYINQGYDFISDCRNAGTCSPTTSDTLAVRSPSINALDRGDFLSTTDITADFFKRNGCTTTEDSSWHGTFIAGIIAGKENNIGIVGASPKTKILPVRIGGKCGGKDSDILKGMLWAAGLNATLPNPNPAKVINLSLGGDGYCASSYRTVFEQLHTAGVSVIISAGNEEEDVSDHTPANCNSKFDRGSKMNNLIVVSSIDRKGELASYGNYNSIFIDREIIDVSVPGGDAGVIGDEGMYSTTSTAKGTNFDVDLIDNYSTYQYKEGTSFSTPLVASLIALIREVRPTIQPEQIRTLLKGNSKPLPNVHALSYLDAQLINNKSKYVDGRYDCVYNRCGAGMPHAELVLQSAKIGWSPIATIDGGYGEILFKKGESLPAKRVIQLQNISGALARLTGIVIADDQNQVSTDVLVTTDCHTKDTSNNGTCSIVLTATNTDFTDQRLLVRANDMEVSYKLAARDRIAVPTIKFVDPFAPVVTPPTPNPTPTPNPIPAPTPVPTPTPTPTPSNSGGGGGCTINNYLINPSSSDSSDVSNYMEWLLLFTGLLLITRKKTVLKKL